MFPVLSANTLSTGYNLNNSLRLRTSASASLTRTPASAGNRKTWTMSMWAKRGKLSAYAPIFSGYSDLANKDYNSATVFFDTDDTLYFSVLGTIGAAVITARTPAVFRDPSAWYHIVVALDTNQATNSNGLKIYINGVQQTLTFTSYTQNAQPVINSTTLQYIAAHSLNTIYGVIQYFDGYMAEVNFIDGQQLTPSSFGSTNATTGVWQPAKYTGTYGTNGFYLNFSDIALTSGSNAGLGKDFSGNGNFWNTNNISVTAGTTYDAMLDVPTLTSATVANYATLNPLNVTANTPSSGNLRSVLGSTENGIASTIAIPLNLKSYWEITPTTSSASLIGTYAGVATLSTAMDQAGSYAFAGVYAFLALNNLRLWANGVAGSTATGTLANTSILQVAVDNTSSGSNTYVWIGKDNVWYNSTLGTTGNPATAANPTFTIAKQDFYAYFSGYLNTINVNFGQRPFSYTPPTGFVALNTYNLPDSTIVKGNTVMDATLYTGTGSALTVTNAGSFKPDFVWIKSRSNTYNHGLFDSVRGALKVLQSSSTAAEATESAGTSLTGFNSNGFALGTNGSTVSTNVNGATFVGWQWQAGQGSTSSNTSGSITSTTSVNATAGFSVVTYTSQASGSATFGHGLGVAPSMIFLKGRNVAGGWYVYHSALGGTKYLALQSTGAATTAADGWNNTNPTSTVVSVGNGYAGSYNMVAYCWAEIAGFSKFGSYTGNGSADGPFVYTGFRPKFVLYKNSSFAGTSWAMLDSSRNTYNVVNARLFSDSSGAEDTSVSPMDFTSNGFKVRSTNDGVNRNANTIIYMAFAENPFKNANAR